MYQEDHFHEYEQNKKPYMNDAEGVQVELIF